MKKIRKRLLAVLAMLAMVTAMMPQMHQQAYADAKTGTEYPYYGENPTAYTPETITKDNSMPTTWSEILYPGDSLKFTKDEEGASPRFMGFSSTSELSADFGLSDGTNCITGVVNATGETLSIYDSIVLADDADYALYIYGNNRGGAGLKDDPNTLEIDEAHYGAYGISRIEKVPLYINLWYQLYGGSIPNGGAANPTKILNPKTTTFLKLNSAPSISGKVLDYWMGMNEWVAASADMPAGAVAINPVYPPDAAEEDFNPDYKYNGPYTNGVSIGLMAYYKPITYTIKIGDVSAYEEIYGSKGFLQWYDPISTNSKEYLKSQVKYNAPDTTAWKVVGTDTRNTLDINGTVTADEATGDSSYYGLRAQAPSADYILSGWSIKDSAGNELNDTYKLRMTKTYAEKVNGVWNYLLCIATNGNYYEANLADGKTFVVTPIFTQKAQAEDISTINITMDLTDFVGGDEYDGRAERATIVSGDSGKYTITNEHTCIAPNSNFGGGEFVVEPGDTLYYSAEFKAGKSDGYQFANSVDLVVNGENVATATSDGESVLFIDAIQQTASGGVTNVFFNEVAAGEESWSAVVDYFGISRSKENMTAMKCVDYGLDAAPCTVITFQISVNGGALHSFDFEPATSTGTETFTSTGAASVSDDWSYSFKKGDIVTWKCFGYNFREDDRMGWEPYQVGEAKSGGFVVGGGEMPQTKDLHVLSYGHGTIKVNGANYGAEHQGSWYEGKSVTIEAVPDAGYKFSRWWIKKASEQRAVIKDENPITFNIDDDTEANATFGLEKATIIIEAPKAGTTAATTPKIILPSGAGYSPDTNSMFGPSLKWVVAPDRNAAVLDPSTEFEEGKTYYARVRLRDGADGFAAKAGGASFDTELMVTGGIKEWQSNSANTGEGGEGYVAIDAIIAVKLPDATKPHAHTWDAGRVTKDPTTTTTGVRTYTCTGCKATKTSVIAKLTESQALSKGATALAAEEAILSTKSEEPKGAAYTVMLARAKKASNNSIALGWASVKDAKEYVIYGNKCGTTNRYKRLTSTAKNSANISKVVGKKVAKATYYKFIVVALDKNNRVLATSKTIYVATTGGKIGNDKSVTIKAKVDSKGKAIKTYKSLSSTVIKKGKSVTIKATATPVSKKLAVKKHRGIAFESSNTKIATVNSKGKITAKSKGSCYIYAYAQNGICRRFKITVK